MPFIKGESRAKLNTLLLHIQQKRSNCGRKAVYSYEGYLKSQETTESVDSEKDTIE